VKYFSLNAKNSKLSLGGQEERRAGSSYFSRHSERSEESYFIVHSSLFSIRYFIPLNAIRFLIKTNL
jgi:hypothetical protein